MLTRQGDGQPVVYFPGMAGPRIWCSNETATSGFVKHWDEIMTTLASTQDTA